MEDLPRFCSFLSRKCSLHESHRSSVRFRRQLQLLLLAARHPTTDFPIFDWRDFFRHLSDCHIVEDDGDPRSGESSSAVSLRKNAMPSAASNAADTLSSEIDFHDTIA